MSSADAFPMAIGPRPAVSAAISEDMAKGELIPLRRVESAILHLRGHRVMLDSDLSDLYGVPVKRLNEQTSRNRERFPEDFMFQLSVEETASLRSQIVTLKTGGRGQHRKYRPYAFTEQGVAMLSSVLRGPRAVQVNIEIMRAFVRLRALLQTNAELAEKLTALEDKYDLQFKAVFEVISELMRPAEVPQRRIGFATG